MHVESLTQSEAKLAALFGPVVPLAAVCDACFGMNIQQAKGEAVFHRLPVPTFRLKEGSRVPVLVHSVALAAFIDAMPPDVAADLVLAGQRWGDLYKPGDAATKIVAQASRILELRDKIAELEAHYGVVDPPAQHRPSRKKARR